MAQELEESLTKVYLGLQSWFSLFLQERDDHEEKCIGAESTRVRLFKIPNFQHLFQNKYHWLNDLRFTQITFDEAHTRQAIVAFRPESDVHLDGC